MSTFERFTVWGSSAATAITGLGFLWTKYLVTPTEPWAVINHPLEPWFLKTHIVVAPVFLFAIGLILTRHIMPHIRQKVRRGRRSGLIMVWTLLPMAVSGYLIQVVTSPGWVTALVVLHLVTGGLFVLGLAGHGLVLALKTLRARTSGAEGHGTYGRYRQA